MIEVVRVDGKEASLKGYIPTQIDVLMDEGDDRTRDVQILVTDVAVIVYTRVRTGPEDEEVEPWGMKGTVMFK